jgi:hypothetical protein
MPNVKLDFVVVLPSGVESNHEVLYYDDGRRQNNSAQRAAEEAVRQAKLTTSRKEPQTVRVKVFALSIKLGTLVRSPAGTFDIMPPLERMTEDEYTDELNELLADLPDEFKNYVSQTAYEEGHSAGYEEVITCARNIVCNLKPAVDAYTKRLKGK